MLKPVWMMLIVEASPSALEKMPVASYPKRCLSASVLTDVFSQLSTLSGTSGRAYLPSSRTASRSVRRGKEKSRRLRCKIRKTTVKTAISAVRATMA